MATPEEAQAAILKMLKAFGVTDDKLVDRQELYWDVLQALPTSAIVEACRKAVCGEIPGVGKFPPTTAELCIAIRGAPQAPKKAPFIFRQRGDDAFVSSRGTLYLNGRVYEREEWLDQRDTPQIEADFDWKLIEDKSK